MRNQILWSDETKIDLFGLNDQLSRLEETWHLPYGEFRWWQHHAVGMSFSGRDWETSQDRGKDERSKVQRDPSWTLAPEVQSEVLSAKVHLPIGQQP